MLKDFEWPEIGDILIKESAGQHSAHLQVFGGVDFSEYMLGYLQGAKTLIDQGLTDNTFDLTVYPILFLCRQFIELSLKEILFFGQKLSDEPFNIPNSHKLNSLWEKARDVLENELPHDDRKTLDAVENMIMELHEIDSSSVSFRYPLDTNGRPSLPEDLHYIDMEQLQLGMESLGNFFSGVTDALDEQLKQKRGMESH